MTLHITHYGKTNIITPKICKKILFTLFFNKYSENIKDYS